MFVDRKEAGKRLAEALDDYKEKNILVLAIPRGGVALGYEVAKYLESEFSLLIARKLPFPRNPEAGFGAIAEDGSTFVNERISAGLKPSVIEEIKSEQREEIERRILVLRNGKPLPKIKGRRVVLVDDGIAMGSTIVSSVMLCKKREAKEIVVAVPVAGEEVARMVSRKVDKLVVLEQPDDFYAVAQVYKNWHDVSDEEVLRIMKQWKRTK